VPLLIAAIWASLSGWTGTAAASNIEIVQGSLTDELVNQDHMLTKTSQLQFETNQPEKHDGDGTRLKMGSAPAGANIVYKLEQQIVSFSVDVYQHSGYTASPLKFYVSSDNTEGSYQQIVPDVSKLPKDGYATTEHHYYTSANIPTEKYYLKIEFAERTPDCSWNPQLAKVEIHYSSISRDKLPVVQDQNFFYLDDTPVSGTVKVIVPGGEQLYYSVITLPEHGNASVAPNGLWTYEPASGYSGADQFQVAVVNEHGGRSIATIRLSRAVVSVIDELEDWSLASFYTPQLEHDSSQSFDRTLVKIGNAAPGANIVYDLSNYNDIHRFKLDTYTLTAEPAAQLKFYSSADGISFDHELVISPVLGQRYNSHQHVIYETYNIPANHKFIKIAFATWENRYNPYLGKVQLDMLADFINHVPVIENWYGRTVQSDRLAGQAYGYDADGDALAYYLHTPADYGQADVQEDGAWIYMPGSYSGDAQFKLAADDGHGGVAVSTVYLSVYEENTPPTVGNVSISTMKETVIASKLEFVDVDSQPLVYSLETAPAHGAADIRADGSYTYTPHQNYVGFDEFAVRVEDTMGGASIAAVKVVVDQAVYDELKDFTQLYDYSPGLRFGDPSMINEFDYDTDRITIGDAPAGAYMIYRTTFDMKHFFIDAFRQRDQPASELKFYISANNIDYAEVVPKVTDVGKIGWAHYGLFAYEAEHFPVGTRYLKIVFATKPNNNNPQISKVRINDRESILYDPDYSYTKDGTIYTVTASDINALLTQQSHPRLMVTGAEIQRKRELYGLDQFITKNTDSIIAVADSLIGKAPNQYIMSPTNDLLDVSRSVLHRLQNLAMAYLLNENEEQRAAYAAQAWIEIDAVSKFPDWHHVHFLDAAEMTAAFALAYDWMYDAWSEEQKEVMREAMVDHALQYGVPNYRGQTGYVVKENNQNAVVNGGLVLGALAIGNDGGYGLMAGEIVIGAMKSVEDYYLQMYAPAGGYMEGPVYWSYGTEYLTFMLSALETALGSDYELSNHDGLKETGYFPIYIEGTNGVFNYADGGAIKITANPLVWFADRYDQEHMLWHYRTSRNDVGGVTGMAWYDPDKFTIPSEDYFPLDKFFPGTEAGGMRSAWYDDAALYAGFKGGYNEHLHGHLDAGSFVFDALGVRWALDLGPEDYAISGLGGYNYGGTRWWYYRLRPEGHNTIVINPGFDPSQDVRGKSEIIAFESEPTGAYSIVDLQPVYGQGVESMQRGFYMLDNRRQFLVQDEIKLKEDSDIWWFMHTEQDITLSDDGTEAVLARNDKRLWVKILAPAPAKFTVMDAKPMPNSPNPNLISSNISKGKTQKTNDGVRKLSIELAGTKEAVISVLMVPLEAGQLPPDAGSLPEVTLMENWEIDTRGLATASQIYLNGQPLPGFFPNKYLYSVTLPFGGALEPAIDVTAPFDAGVTRTGEAPGIAVIRLTDPNGLYKPTTYTIRYNSGLYEAENASIVPGKVDTIHSGFTGSGFADTENSIGSYLEFQVEVAAAGNYGLQLRYANGSANDRPVQVQVNGVVVEEYLSLPSTAVWNNWQTAGITATLQAGVNTVRYTPLTAEGAANMDHLQLHLVPNP
jgi:hypothetical protein